ncbi:MAG: hypothetical protein ACOC9Y_01900 [Chloroflexota bacterium]
MAASEPTGTSRKSYAERLGHLGRILDEGNYRSICIVEVETDLIARACNSPGRDVDMIELPESAVNPRVAGREGTRGRYQSVLSAIGTWLDRRGADDIVVTEGDGFIAVGGYAPYEIGESGMMRGPFEELLLPDELAELARLGGASDTVTTSIESNGSGPSDGAAGDDQDWGELLPDGVRQLRGTVRRLASGITSRSN